MAHPAMLSKPHAGMESGDYPGLWPCLKQIDIYLDSKKESIEWFKILQQNKIATLAEAADVLSEEWTEMKIPLRVLIELRALHQAFLASKSLPASRVSELQESNTRPRIASVEDISPFLASNMISLEDSEPKKKKGGTLRKNTNKMKARKHLSMSVEPCSTDDISGVINILGSPEYTTMLYNKILKGKALNPRRPVSMELDVYEKHVDLEIRNSTQTAASCNLAILIFARNSLRSFTKMMDKYLHSVCKADTTIQQTPILLVGILADNLTRKNKFVSKESVLEAAEIMKAIRYIEVTSTNEAKDVFLEAGRILIRSHFNEPTVARTMEIHSKIQKVNDKKPELLLKKKTLATLPNSFMQCAATLQRIRLDGNVIQHFPNELLYCPQLREIGLSYNQIEEIPSSIAKLTLLTRFEIENNLLDNLPVRALQTMQNLQEFKATGNPLSKLPPELFKGKAVKLELIQSFKGNLPNEQEDSLHTAELIVAEKDREPFPVFNVPLQELMQNEYELFPDVPVPRIARYTMREIITNAICLEGVFRLAGQNDQCTELRNEIDQSTSIVFKKDENPHNITGVLKQWLRGLPEPALLFENFTEIIKLGTSSVEEQIRGFTEMLEKLPKENRHLVRQMCRLMYIVGQNAEVNRMGHSNVAKVIGPNMAYSRQPENENPMETINNVNSVNEFFTTIAEAFPQIFEKDGEDLFALDYLQDDPNPWAIFYRKLSGHTKSVISAVVSSTGEYLWTADTSGSFRIWNTASNELCSSYETTMGRINCMVRTGTTVWLESMECIQIRNEDTGDLIHQIDTPTITLNAVDDEVWATTETMKILIYDTETYEPEAIDLEGFVVIHLAQVGTSVWGLCTDRKIRVWNAETREFEKELDISSHARLISFSPIGGRVWGAFDNASIIVWNGTTFEQEACLDQHHSGKVFGASLVGKYVWTFAWDGQIHAYDAETFAYIGPLPSYHSDAIGSIRSLYDEKRSCHKVYTVSWDKTITVWLARDKIISE